MMYIFASHEASESKFRIFGVAVTLTVLDLLCIELFSQPMAGWMSLALSTMWIVGSARFFCGIDWKSASKIAGSFLVVRLGIAILLLNLART